MENRQRLQTPAEFYAHGYRLSGTYDARQRTLGDVLYDNTTSYLTIENAYFSPIELPAEITASYPVAVIAKNELSFALTLNSDDALRRDQKYGSYLALKLMPIFITLPGIEIKGMLRFPGRFDPRVLLHSQTESFITLMDVTIRLIANPQVSYQGAAAVISKAKISFLGLDSL